MNDLVKRLREDWTPIFGGCVGTMFEAADRIEALEKALQMAVEMRALQKTYFKERTKEALIASKQAESAFDRAALEGKDD
jgi:ribulose-5-phosphate 4-epimerase/fuculose-1-phosphate aldolase